MTDILPKAGVQGYASRLSVAPGETIEFKLSCDDGLGESFEAEIVRLIHGDTNPEGPGFIEQVLDTDAGGEYPARHQTIDAGSCVVVEDEGELALDGALTVHAFIQPSTVGKANQTVLGRISGDARGYALLVDEGRLTFVAGDGERMTASLDERLEEGCWYSVAASYDPAQESVLLYCEPVVNSWNSRLSPAVEIHGAARAERSLVGSIGDARVPFTIAGMATSSGSGEVDAHFNGKIDAPKVWRRALTAAELDALTAGGQLPADGLVAAWDFSAEITPEGIRSDRVTDTVGNLNGTCVNFPARAMTGHNWEGIEERFIHAPEQYGAIHFHDDDIEDAGWDTDVTWQVPAEAKSGVYGLRVRCCEVEEHFPFFLLPPRGKATAPVAFLVPTASYLAYANEHLAADGPVAQSIFGHTPVLAERDLYLYHHTELGLSTYDLHSDGSGVHSSSSLRPIVGLRPKHRLGVGGPWQFPADLHLVEWLDALEFEYDVITDRELHDEGVELLNRYRVVLTGSHPEYYSRPMLDAWEEYVGGGGRAMYLGANGFYWIISWHPEKPHLMEVRKAESGSRAWQAEPGQYYMQINGERSGLWRARRRAPQKVFGTGFITEGFDQSSYFDQLPDAADPEVAFMFEGIEPDERIGDFGLEGGGAAGYELDRYDLLLGTPPHAHLVAASAEHTDNYPLVAEEIMFNHPHLGATMDYRVRADIVYFPTRNGGGVFSTSSISWVGSLPHNDNDNNVSRLTANVLRRFMADEPL